MKCIVKDVLVAALLMIAYIVAVSFVALSFADLFAPSADAGERLPTAKIIYSEPAKPTVATAQDWHTNGVVRPQGPIQADRYTAHSPEAKRFVAESIEGPTPGKIHVTVIGNADERARVVNDIKTDPAFDGIRDGLWVQDYEPKDWPVDPKLGFIPGKPAIIVQASKGPNDKKGGKVIYRTQDYAIGAEGLAEAIRKGNPDYRPDRDPGPHKPAPSPAPSLPDSLNIDPKDLLAVGLVAALVLFFPSKKER